MRLLQGIASLDRKEKIVIGGFIGVGLIALIVGGIAGLIVVLDLGGLLEFQPVTAYKALTLHATALFNFWLYAVQVGIILLFLRIYTPGVRLSGLAWYATVGSLALISLAFLGALYSIVVRGASVTYAALYPLSERVPGSVGLVTSFLALYASLALVTVVGLYLPLKAKFEGKVSEWNSITFASFIWFGLLAITIVAASLVYVPELYKLITGKDLFEGYRFTMSWGVMFHNLHYLPIMASVLTWYTLSEAILGVKSVFGETVSKVVFSLYLLVVPPTSLYHFFLEPSLPTHVKLVGSILSLGVSIPTIAVAVIIVSSWEIAARTKYGSAISWIRHLPWSNPAFITIVAAMLSGLGGGVFANVVIQERIETLTGDTLTVPGYFHFLTIGAVTLTYLGALMYIIPGLTSRRLIGASIIRIITPITLIAIYFFGFSMIWAGLQGAPRRTLDFFPAYGAPETWLAPVKLAGIGGAIALLAGGVYVLLLLLSSATKRGIPIDALPTLNLRAEEYKRILPYYPLIIVVALIGGIYLATILAYSIMQGMPVELG